MVACGNTQLCASANHHAVKAIWPQLADFLADDGTEQAVIKDKIEAHSDPKTEAEIEAANAHICKEDRVHHHSSYYAQ